MGMGMTKLSLHLLCIGCVKTLGVYEIGSLRYVLIKMFFDVYVCVWVITFSISVF